MMQSLSDALPQLLRSISKNEEAALLFLQELWPVIIGKQLARSATPIVLEQGVLVLCVTSTAWEKHLPEFENLILNSVNRFWGESFIERISVEFDQNDRRPQRGTDSFSSSS